MPPFFAIIVFALAGCFTQTPAPLPTYVPTLGLPALATVPRKRVEIPATNTSEAEQQIVSELIIMEDLEPTPTLRPTAVSTPTPLKIAVNYRVPVNAPFLSAMPSRVPCDDPGLVFKSQFPSKIGGAARRFHGYLPPCYGVDGRAYPVLYLIHGSIQDDSHWLNLGLSQYADAGIEQERYPPFIAIMPSSGNLGNLTSGGDKSVEGIIINVLLPFIDENLCSWQEANGRHIGGISRGGYWALETAFRNPELFGAVAGHSSHLRFETDPEKYNPLATYAEADLQNMRIWMDRGEKDFLRIGQEQMHSKLEEAGIAHDYWVNPGGHGDAYWADHIGEYLDWHTATWPMDRKLYPLCDLDNQTD